MASGVAWTPAKDSPIKRLHSPKPSAFLRLQDSGGVLRHPRDRVCCRNSCGVSLSCLLYLVLDYCFGLDLACFLFGLSYEHWIPRRRQTASWIGYELRTFALCIRTLTHLPTNLPTLIGPGTPSSSIFDMYINTTNQKRYKILLNTRSSSLSGETWTPFGF